MDGKSPLEADEIDELLIRNINNHEDLNEYKQKNIKDVNFWTLSRTFSSDQLWNDGFIRQLHKRMYGKLWCCAGGYRKIQRNLALKII
jgi:hypothetical protein